LNTFCECNKKKKRQFIKKNKQKIIQNQFTIKTQSADMVYMQHANSLINLEKKALLSLTIKIINVVSWGKREPCK